MKIKIKESTMIRPAQDLPKQHLWLSNLDLLQEKNNVPTLYFYKKPENCCLEVMEVLKEAMRKVLVEFFPVAGRLVRDENGRLEINCNGEGVLFVEAETDTTIDELGDLMLNADVPRLIPSVDYSSPDISSFPLLVIQVTTFICGGASMGMRWQHTLGDGISALHFINTWCDIARGFPIRISPWIDRTILCSGNPPNPKFEHIEYQKPLTMKTLTQNRKCQGNSMEVFRITRYQLDTLKNKINEDSTIKYTSYEILTAHIWRCITKARELPNDQETKLYITVDARSRLDPPLPLGYFGNAIFSTTPVKLTRELLLEPLKDTIARVHREIKMMDNEYLRSSLDYLQVVGDLKPIMRGAQSCRCPNLNIVSWMRLPIYDADFGMGKPIYVRPANPLEGKVYLLPSPNNNGDWTLAICLDADCVQHFKNLFYEFL